MSRFESAQRVVFSVAASLFVGVVMFSAAEPVMPIV